MIRLVNTLLIIVLLTSSAVFAQSGEWWKRNEENSSSTQEDTTVVREIRDTTYTPGKVVVHKDPRIEKLIKFKSAKIPPATAPKKDGYRVQLFFDQDRKKVDDARSKMLQINGRADTYVEYKAPNYNLLLGNYRTRLEAEKARAELLGEFPEAIIVKDRIYFPDIDQD